MFLWCLLCTAGVVGAILAVTFTIGVVQRRHSVIDVAWGLGFVGVAVAAYLMSSGHGDGARRLLVTALTVVWGLRLAVHIGMRMRGSSGEDPRYERLLSRVSGSRNVYAAKSLYLVQGVTLWFVSLPVQVAVFEHGGIGVFGYLGAVVWLVGFVFESVGDAQLTRFKADPANKGKVMDKGLWRYTRHPNYFGDACVWWGLFLIACDHWTGVLTVLSPLAMTYFLARKTGKPLLERQMAKTRPGYADYVSRTSGFFPLPPRE